MRNELIKRMCATALLISISILIPLVSPAKVIIPPASYTLASHVPVFIAMFISPASAIAVAAGTTLGFFFSGQFAPVIVMRAASHIVFAICGALYLKRRRSIGAVQMQIFNVAVALIHAVCEVLAVCAFYAVSGINIYADGTFFYSVVVMVGVGTVAHSIVDFLIALVIVKTLKRQKNLRNLFAG